MSWGLSSVVRYLFVCVVNLRLVFAKRLMCVCEVCAEGFCGGTYRGSRCSYSLDSGGPLVDSTLEGISWLEGVRP